MCSPHQPPVPSAVHASEITRQESQPPSNNRDRMSAFSPLALESAVRLPLVPASPPPGVNVVVVGVPPSRGVYLFTTLISHLRFAQLRWPGNSKGEQRKLPKYICMYICVGMYIQTYHRTHGIPHRIHPPQPPRIESIKFVQLKNKPTAPSPNVCMSSICVFYQSKREGWGRMRGVYE